MTSSFDTTPGTIGPGMIRFYDAILNPLEAGEYTLKAEHQVKDLPGETPPPYIATQQIIVDGPRYNISPADIHMVYPPANQEGLYDTVMPNMVFTNFALPWARDIDPAVKTNSNLKATDKDGNPIPWIGLLTIYPDELVATNGTAKAGEPQTITVSELVHPKDSKILPPVLGDLFGAEDTQVSVVDLDLPYFQSICPTIDELPFLAHAREVNTDGKVLLGMDDDGCFSLVFSNRLPMAPGQNTMYLVSYEGHQDHLHGSTISGDYTKIRLVLLGTWQFKALDAQGSFIQLMANLCLPGRGGVKLLQMPLSDETGTISEDAQKAIQMGFVPMQNNMRQGEESTSWYRGPFVPSPTKRDFSYGPYHYSDHAIHYDPENGLFNHAYSSAWQTGRLLALSDSNFSAAMFNWRNNYLNSIVSTTKQLDTEKLNVIAGESHRLMPTAHARAAVGMLLAGGFSKVKWPQITSRTERVLQEGLPGVFSQEEKIAIVENDADPLLMLVKKIKGEQL
ncbi:hypothetical protein CLV59_105468 [Chitinophaga dinghuensis]|uniref:Uncharacterized protein n=1 Tax=Chitinophaga dinghuensis TaxID=1539050 RepID=A0A327VWN5_9BACT|nr:hypothetical protein [Chitinophaga dinghuensis]RAJ80359.1 hypothetical protein CLV59_105468 [Chitinophaga dinghuensis]